MQAFFESLIGEKPLQVTPLSGGDINAVYAVLYGQQTHVFKINDAHRYPEMLLHEADGLHLLAASATVRVPQVYRFGLHAEKQYLELEKIDAGTSNDTTWQKLGKQLAQLHQCTQPLFGLNHDNYIGSLQQNNKPAASWAEFLISQRLQPMLELAVNQGDVNYVEAKMAEPFFNRIAELFPAEKPALLHGDFWSGNLLINDLHEPVLIDPAVYYGHREMDLAMMHLFGGFPARVFESYHETFPLETGWQNRLKLHQLYPLLVHVNLFGRSYWKRVQEILEPFSPKNVS